MFLFFYLPIQDKFIFKKKSQATMVLNKSQKKLIKPIQTKYINHYYTKFNFIYFFKTISSDAKQKKSLNFLKINSNKIINNNFKIKCNFTDLNKLKKNKFKRIFLYFLTKYNLLYDRQSIFKNLFQFFKTETNLIFSKFFLKEKFKKLYKYTFYDISSNLFKDDQQLCLRTAQTNKINYSFLGKSSTVAEFFFKKKFNLRQKLNKANKKKFNLRQKLNKANKKKFKNNICRYILQNQIKSKKNKIILFYKYSNFSRFSDNWSINLNLLNSNMFKKLKFKFILKYYIYSISLKIFYKLLKLYSMIENTNIKRFLYHKNLFLIKNLIKKGTNQKVSILIRIINIYSRFFKSVNNYNQNSYQDFISNNFLNIYQFLKFKLNQAESHQAESDPAWLAFFFFQSESLQESEAYEKKKADPTIQDPLTVRKLFTIKDLQHTWFSIMYTVSSAYSFNPGKYKYYSPLQDGVFFAGKQSCFASCRPYKLKESLIDSKYPDFKNKSQEKNKNYLKSFINSFLKIKNDLDKQNKKKIDLSQLSIGQNKQLWQLKKKTHNNKSLLWIFRKYWLKFFFKVLLFKATSSLNNKLFVFLFKKKTKTVFFKRLLSKQGYKKYVQTSSCKIKYYAAGAKKSKISEYNLRKELLSKRAPILVLNTNFCLSS